MSFKPIVLNDGKSISSLEQALGFIDRNVSNRQRSHPLWDSAISAAKNAVVDPAWEQQARDAIYNALVSDSLA